MGDTSYARCGELSLAYKVIGDGPLNLLLAGSFVSHVEMTWADPVIKGWLESLASFARVAFFDKAGVGLSDPVPKVQSVEQRVRELEAVMDAVGFERAAVLGISEGGAAAILFAATSPDRVQALILAGTFGVNALTSFDEAEIEPAVIGARWRERTDERYAFDAQQLERLRRMIRHVRDDWGSGEALVELLPSMRSKVQLGMIERMSASPGMARATLQAAFNIDLTDILPTVRVPTLVLHAKGDLVPVQCGRHLADTIPGASIVELEGSDHAPWNTEPERFLLEVERFLTGAEGTTARRALRTILFTDIVGSTQHAAALGDGAWHARLERIDAATRSAVTRFGGTVVKSTGDGHLATLDGPAQAIACAEAVRDVFAELDLEVRQGVHTGECELLGEDIGGMAVHIAARVMGQAGAGEILTSSTVRDLVVGSGISFEDRGERELKGVPGSWRLLAVRPEGSLPDSPEAALAAMPTPPARDHMRTSDRAAAAVARRAPGLMRALARIAP